jgi:hypothetical protein
MRAPPKRLAGHGLRDVAASTMSRTPMFVDVIV